MAAAQQQEAPGGAWASPISSELIVSQSIGLGSPVIASDGRVFWLEGRPTEGGRQVLVSRSPDGKVTDVLPGKDSGFNARTRVHEYGGGESVVGPDGTIFWSNFKDQRIYKQAVGGDGAWSDPQPLTGADIQHRFADAVVDTKFNRLVAVREDHSGEGEPVNSVCAVDLKTGESTVLAEGRDFYTSPRLNADSTKLAWVCYDHPNMPWDDTELWVADVSDSGELANQRKVAGGPGESIVQPLWSDAGLTFISDRTDWWNIYTETGPGEVRPVLKLDAEFAGPAWMFGSRSYQHLPDGAILAVYSAPETAGSTLAVISPADGKVKELRTPYSSYGNVNVQQVNGRLLVGLLGTSPLKPSEVALLDVGSVDELIASTPEQWQALQQSSRAQVDEGYLSQPETIAFPTTGGKTAYMNHYPPANKDFQLPAGDAPPLLVKIHGGPTAAASTAFSMGIQFWTSRGYAVADVNYGGSTGYGRKYRKRLAGNWGVVDVDDCSNAATHLAEQKLADPKKLCITGGSAGGYTTLACLAFKNVFKAGASHYGVADLQLLAAETHKFESRYLDGLIGRWPEDKQIYKERSPINALDQFDEPVVFFQGEEDKVVPPNQAVDMYDALKAKGLSTALVLFPGEQHGFRQAPNIRRALDGELYFYGKTLGFPVSMPDGLEPPEIVNAKA
jgi:dipeptidyl aminopeptidase/acylaminoacyl peptidase